MPMTRVVTRLYLPPVLRADVEAFALAEGVSVNEYCARVLAASVGYRGPLGCEQGGSRVAGVGPRSKARRADGEPMGDRLVEKP